ncbi:MAG TPA: hypothetical protein PLY40_03865 [Bacillota bacterium]|nr:hypothetical protein [Bacillota bacterium]
MFGRHVLLAVLLGFLLTIPWSVLSFQEDPCYKLARGVKLLGAENIFYHRHFFISTVSADLDQLKGRLENTPVLRSATSAGWRLSSGLEENYVVLQVSGADCLASKILADDLSDLLAQEDLLSQAYHLECYLQGRADDLEDLSLALVNLLEGELFSIQRYHESVHLLAYVRWYKESFLLEGKPVNLNLELKYDPASGSIRLQAGIPVLLTLSHYEKI